MKRFFLLVVLLAFAAIPSLAQKKEIIQLQSAVARLETDLRDLRSSMDERMGMLRQVVEQATDNVNRLNVAIEKSQLAIQSSIAQQGPKMDSVVQNVQAVNDSVEDVRARVAKLSEQMVQMRAALESLQAPPPAVIPTSTAAAPPPPEVLYESALRDLNGGNYALASQGFQDYLKHYGETDLAPNAQFYIGEALYREGKFREAIAAYDQVLERYPRNNKTAAAHLKKGFALVELRQYDAGERELRELVRRYPRTDEAKLAQERLRTLARRANAAPARSSREE